MQQNASDNKASQTFSFAKKYGFQPISLVDGPLFGQHVSQMSGLLSSYTCFSSMLMWEERYQVFRKQEGGYLLLLLKGGAGELWEAIPPLGPYDQEHLPELTRIWKGLDKMFRCQGQELLCTEIMDWMIPWLDRMGFEHELEYDRDSSDYIYKAEEFQSIFQEQKTRYNIRYFLKRQDAEFWELNGEDFPLYESILKKTFCECHECEECESGCQIKALRCMVHHHGKLGVKGGLVLLDGKPVGYVGVERINDILLYQAFKQQRGIRGLSEWMRKTALERWGEGIRFVNYTEDMGLPGLRSHKQNLCAYRLSHNYYGRIFAL